jgi:hypothetical protein
VCLHELVVWVDFFPIYGIAKAYSFCYNAIILKIMKNALIGLNRIYLI